MQRRAVRMTSEQLLVPLDALLTHVAAPEHLAAPSQQKAQELTKLLKELYDVTVALCGRHYGPFEELFVDGLDSESIWEELQLSNKPLIASMKKRIRKIKLRLKRKEEFERAQAEQAEQQGSSGDEEDEEAEESDEEEEQQMQHGDAEESEDEDEGEEDEQADEEEEEEEDGVAAETSIDSGLIARMLGKSSNSNAASSDEEQAMDEEEGEQDDEDDEESSGEADEGSDMRHIDIKQDQFFDLDEMEKYIGEEEDKYMRREAKKAQRMMQRGHDGVNEDDDDFDDDDDDDEEDGEGFDFFDEGDDEDDDGADVRFDDFWGDEVKVKKDSKSKKDKKEKPSKRVAQQIEEDEDEDEDDDEDADGADLFDDDDDEDRDDDESDARDSDDDAAKTAQLSSYEKAQLKMREKIAEIEQELIGEKPWQLQGEVEGRMRPENSLLSAMIVDMERASKPTPIITVEKTATLEDLIKKRIQDANFDDVIPRAIANAALKPGAAVELPEVSKEKSKEGLGEIYEKEFMKQTMGVQETDPHASKKDEILKAFQKLCRKLDALTHFHYAPKPVVADVQISTNVPAIHMEEILPLAMSHTDVAAPEEIYEKKRGREGAFQAAEEMSQVDRKRVRRAKKEERRKEKRRDEYEQRLVALVNPGMGNKYEKEKMLKELRGDKRVVTGEHAGTDTKGLTNSTTFFRNLQESVQSAANAARQSASEQGKPSSSKKTSHFKL